MKSMKRILSMLMTCTILFACFGCAANPSASSSAGSSGSAVSSGGSGEDADYPTGPITVIVGNAAGGGSDVTCRIMTKYLPKYLDDATIVVNNNGTGSGEAAFLSVASAAPDGYTLGFFHGGQIMRTLMMDTQYQIEDYKFIAQQTSEPRTIAVRADDDRFPDLEAFLAYAKEHPGEITVSDSGFGSSEHFATAAVMYYGDVELTPVHTNGTAESKTNLLGGHTDALAGGLSEVVSLVNDGSVRLLGVTSEERNEFFPDVPTFKELGIDAVYDVLRGFYCHKDTPQEIVDKIADAMEQVSQDPDFIADMSNLTLPVIYRDSEEFTQFVMQTKEDYTALLEAIDWEGQQ